MLNHQANINRHKVANNQTSLEADIVAVEEPLQITLTQGQTNQVFSITLRTPGDDHYLASGLLFSEGIIHRFDDIIDMNNQRLDDKITVNRLDVTLRAGLKFDLTSTERRYVSHSGCGLCGKISLQSLQLKQARPLRPISCQLNNQTIQQFRQVLAEQELFSTTGGSHVAGLIYQKNGKFVIEQSPFFEDVGRHNALDKLIGYELQQHDLGQTGVLLLSGRIGFELIQKAVVAGFAVIVALGAPSNLAIKAANQFGIALIGFAKDNCFNLYTPDEHLIADNSKIIDG